MTKLSIVKPETGKKNTIEEPKVATGFTAIETVVNGEIEGTNNIKAEGVAEANLSAAVQTLLNTKSAFALTLKISASLTITAVSGELISASGEEAVITLPAATANRIVGVFSTATKGCKVNTAGGGSEIIGDFLQATGCRLTANQHIIVQADGTNWKILAGEPKREQKYLALKSITKEKEETPSLVRPTFVTAVPNGAAAFTVGVAILNSSATASVSFIVPPGQSYFWSGSATVVEVSYLTL